MDLSGAFEGVLQIQYVPNYGCNNANGENRNISPLNTVGLNYLFLNWVALNSTHWPVLPCRSVAITTAFFFFFRGRRGILCSIYTLLILMFYHLENSLMCTENHKFFLCVYKDLFLLSPRTKWVCLYETPQKQNLCRCSFLFGFPLICKSCNLRLKLTEPTSKPAQ